MPLPEPTWRFHALAAVATAIGVLLWMGPQPSPAPSPLPELPSDAPDLVAVFAGHADRGQARADATATAEFFAGLAGALERDGQLAPPRISSSARVEDVRVLSREYLAEVRGLGTRYPAFGVTVGAYLAAKLGEEGGELTSEKRSAWIAAYRTLADCCRVAEATL